MTRTGLRPVCSKIFLISSAIAAALPPGSEMTRVFPDEPKAPSAPSTARIASFTLATCSGYH